MRRENEAARPFFAFLSANPRYVSIAGNRAWLPPSFRFPVTNSLMREKRLSSDPVSETLTARERAEGLRGVIARDG